MKQAILVRTDLKMSKGKTAAQVAHASVEAVNNSSKNSVAAWRKEGAKKVVLKVSSEKELLEYHRKARANKLATALITDAGKTEVSPGTKTALGVGPDKDEKVDKVTGGLKIL